MCKKRTTLAASLQPVYGREADDYEQATGRIGLAVANNADPQPDIADILQSCGFRTHREFVKNMVK